MRLLVIAFSGSIGYAENRLRAVREGVGGSERVGSRQDQGLMAERYQRQREDAKQAHEDLPGWQTETHKPLSSSSFLSRPGQRVHAA
jgi:hypothetical protein